MSWPLHEESPEPQTLSRLVVMDRGVTARFLVREHLTGPRQGPQSARGALKPMGSTFCAVSKTTLTPPTRLKARGKVRARRGVEGLSLRIGLTARDRCDVLRLVELLIRKTIVTGLLLINIGPV